MYSSRRLQSRVLACSINRGLGRVSMVPKLSFSRLNSRSFSTMNVFSAGSNSESDVARQKEVTKVLCSIMHPEKGEDVVFSGMVTGTQVVGDTVLVSLRLDNSYRALKKAIESTQTTKLSWVRGVRVSLASKTDDPDAEAFLRKKNAAPLDAGMTGSGPRGLAGVRSVIAVSSGKGGVGKSSVAVSLAVALSKRFVGDRPCRVGVFDADIFGPSLPTMVRAPLGMREVDVDGDKRLEPLEAYGLKLMSYGFIPDASVAGKAAGAALRGPLVTQLTTELLTRTHWGELDYLVIDMPPGTGDVALTLTQTARITGAVVVTTPQKLAFVDVVRGIDFFDQTSVPVLGLVLNMAFFVAPGDPAAEKHFIFGDGRPFLNQLQSRWGVEQVTELPVLPAVAARGDSGTPFALVEPAGPYQVLEQQALDAFDLLAASVAETCEDPIRRAALQKVHATLYYDATAHEVQVRDSEKNVLRRLDPKALRVACRCAGCVHELTGEQLLRPERVPQNIKPKTLTARGQYAVSVTWTDGHQSSMYPWTQLLSLPEKKQE